jgi:hypothetical protein
MITETPVIAELSSKDLGGKFRQERSFRDHARCRGAHETAVSAEVRELMGWVGRPRVVALAGPCVARLAVPGPWVARLAVARPGPIARPCVAGLAVARPGPVTGPSPIARARGASLVGAWPAARGSAVAGAWAGARLGRLAVHRGEPVVDQRHDRRDERRHQAAGDQRGDEAPPAVGQAPPMPRRAPLIADSYRYRRRPYPWRHHGPARLAGARVCSPVPRARTSPVANG